MTLAFTHDVTHRRVETCRACFGRDLRPVLDLGDVPLALDFCAPGSEGPRRELPLRVVHCTSCFLWQLDTVVAPEELYEDYAYRSSISRSFARHCDEIADEALRATAAREPFVVDIASNDGTLLTSFAARGARVLGVDPARNLAPVAESRGVPTLTAYWSEAVATAVAEAHGRADVITGCNVVAHVDDWDDLFAGIARLLADDGMFVIEVPHLQELIRLHAYDTIFHEHLSYISLRPLMTAVERHGLALTRVSRHAIHCGTVRLVVERAPGRRADGSVDDVLADEEGYGLYSERSVVAFAEQIAAVQADQRATIAELLAAGLTIDGYGASGKGVMLLSSLGLDARQIRRIYDDTPEKQGKVVAGLEIPVVSSTELGASPPELLLVLAWNFADEIIAKTRGYADAGGRYILPLPVMRVL